MPGADHNNTFMIAGQEYIDKLRIFMCECLGEPVPEIAQVEAKVEEAGQGKDAPEESKIEQEEEAELPAASSDEECEESKV